MQKALESIFGPELLGILGFAFMLLILVPKFVRRWRGVQSQKKDPNNQRTPILGLRSMQADPDVSASQIEPHPDHGNALACLHADFKAIIAESILWIVPVIVVLLTIPAGQLSLRSILLVATIPLALVGMHHLIHLGDHVVFYKTGAIMRHKLRKISLDYNAICEITERKPILPWMSPSYILHLDDDKLVVLDGTCYVNGRKVLKKLLNAMDARTIRSAADEANRMG